jgi:hypothetical protein
MLYQSRCDLLHRDGATEDPAAFETKVIAARTITKPDIIMLRASGMRRLRNDVGCIEFSQIATLAFQRSALILSL